MQKHPLIQCHLSSLGHGWKLVDGLCLPVRYDQQALPLSLLPVCVNTIDNNEQNMYSDFNDVMLMYVIVTRRKTVIQQLIVKTTLNIITARLIILVT